MTIPPDMQAAFYAFNKEADDITAAFVQALDALHR
jgi:hypothetical protein